MKPENNACTGASSAVEFSLFMYLGCHCRGQPCLGRAGATCWWAPTALALLSQVASPTEEVVGPFSTAHSPSAFQNTTGSFRVRKLREKISFWYFQIMPGLVLDDLAQMPSPELFKTPQTQTDCEPNPTRCVMNTNMIFAGGFPSTSSLNWGAL